jgi:hypothetical protein
VNSADSTTAEITLQQRDSRLTIGLGILLIAKNSAGESDVGLFVLLFAVVEILSVL